MNESFEAFLEVDIRVRSRGTYVLYSMYGAQAVLHLLADEELDALDGMEIRRQVTTIQPYALRRLPCE